MSWSWRDVARTAGTVGWTAACAAGATVAGVGTLGRLSWHLTPRIGRAWADGLQWIADIRIEIEGAERLRDPAPRVVTFNHESLLDAAVVCLLMPPGGTAVVKREILLYPFVGAAVWSLGFLIIDRGHHVRALRTMQRAAHRLERERLTVFVAPEGTRAHGPGLGRFKKGAFHLAWEAACPLVPVVIEGSRELLPRGFHLVRAGTIRVRVLEPVDTSRWRADQVSAQADQLRQVYLRALAERTPTPHEAAVASAERVE